MKSKSNLRNVLNWAVFNKIVATLLTFETWHDTLYANIFADPLQCNVIFYLLDHRGHLSKTSGRKKGGGVPMWTTSDGGGKSAIIQKQTNWPGTKKNKKIGVSRVRIGVLHPPFPRASGSQYILRFGRFYARYRPDVCNGAGGVCQTDDVGRGGPKSQFC